MHAALKKFNRKTYSRLMELTNEQYERLCNFLDANMSMEEMAAFEKELANNSAMRTQLDFELSLRNNFLEVNNNAAIAQKEKKVVKLFNSNTWWKAAAAAVLITAISIFYFTKTKKILPTDIVQHKDSLTTTTKDTGIVKIEPIKKDTATKIDVAKLFDDNFEIAKIPENYPIQLAAELADYEKGNYASIQKLDIAKVAETRGGDDKQTILELAHYYKGISLLKLSKVGGAIANLQWVKNNSTDASMKENASWYLGLGYLKMGDITKAKLFFKEISSYGRYKKEVKELLQKIN
jgi:TolA-binding protein